MLPPCCFAKCAGLQGLGVFGSPQAFLKVNTDPRALGRRLTGRRKFATRASCGGMCVGVCDLVPPPVAWFLPPGSRPAGAGFTCCGGLACPLKMRPQAPAKACKGTNEIGTTNPIFWNLQTFVLQNRVARFRPFLGLRPTSPSLGRTPPRPSRFVRAAPPPWRKWLKHRKWPKPNYQNFDFVNIPSQGCGFQFHWWQMSPAPRKCSSALPVNFYCSSLHL